MLKKILKLLESPILGGILGSSIVLLIEYHTGLFMPKQDPLSLSPSPIWSVAAAFTTAALLASVANFLRIFINPQNYFREEFSRVFVSTSFWLTVAFFISLFGRLMFWHPFIVIAYLISDQKMLVSQSSWSEYVLIIVLNLFFYFIASNRYQNWDGLQSIQQHQCMQKSEIANIYQEGVKDFERVFCRRKKLEEYRRVDEKVHIVPLEQSEDYISRAWKDQALELLRLSSSAYVFEKESGWHDIRKCWVGKNINTGKLIFMFPAYAALDKASLDALAKYSKEIARSQKIEIGELIVAFRSGRDQFLTPKGFHKSIRFESQDQLLERLINFADYFNDIQKRVRAHSLPGSSLTLDDVYVPSKLLSSGQEHSSNHVEDFLHSWLDEPGQRQIALLGEYGQGKSSTALMFTYHILNRRKEEKLPKRIPILIELRGKSPRDLQPLELLGAWASKYRIEPQALMRLHFSGRLVLIFEGFDEMALIGNAEMRLRHFRALWRFCYPGAKILITGRPNFFLDDKEMKTALGIIKPVNDKPYCQAVRLAPFNVQQIHQALRLIDPSVREQICYMAETEAKFLELVSRPSLLHVVSVLWKKENLHQRKTDSLTSAYIMDCFVRSSYRRQGLKAQTSREFMALNNSERDYFMCGIATYMASEKLGNQLSSERLNELIDDLIENIPDSVSTSSSEMTDEDKRPLNNRIRDPKEDIEHIKTDVRTCGLLVDDPSTPGTFKFGHKSFMEFLFAAVVKEYIWNTDSEKARAIRKTTNFSLEEILNLPVSIGFLAEMIGTDAGSRSYANANESSIIRNERVIASRLLRVIFGGKEKSFHYFIIRCLIFNSSYYRAIRRLRSSRYMLLSFTYFMFLVSVSSVIMALPPTILKLLFTHNEPSILTFFPESFPSLGVSLLPGIMTSYMMLTVFTLSNKLINSKLKLWSSICKELEISDVVLHQVTWISFLPWTKGKPFNYFPYSKN